MEKVYSSNLFTNGRVEHEEIHSGCNVSISYFSACLKLIYSDGNVIYYGLKIDEDPSVGIKELKGLTRAVLFHHFPTHRGFLTDVKNGGFYPVQPHYEKILRQRARNETVKKVEETNSEKSI